MIRTVVARGELGLRDRHADRIGHALPQWSRRDLHARRVSPLRVARCAAAPLATTLDVVQREIVAT